jgi:ABC-type transport system involved in cytochrome bd biosynthesis fused ATPase/permease subunit
MKSGTCKLLDEPLAGLDSRSVKRVIELIMSRCKKETLIVISHDVSIVGYMDRVIDLSAASRHM